MCRFGRDMINKSAGSGKWDARELQSTDNGDTFLNIEHRSNHFSWRTRRSIFADRPILHYAAGCSDPNLDNREYPQIEPRSRLNTRTMQYTYYLLVLSRARKRCDSIATRDGPPDLRRGDHPRPARDRGHAEIRFDDEKPARAECLCILVNDARANGTRATVVSADAPRDAAGPSERDLHRARARQLTVLRE